MKKIIIATNQLVIGGIEKGLIDLLNILSEKYDITLMVQYAGGELYDDIPKSVTVELIDNCNSMRERLSQNKTLLNKFKCIHNYLKLRISKQYSDQCEILTNLYKKRNEYYDLAIAYSTPVSISNYYIINNVNAHKKIMFLHNDVKEINVSAFESEDLYKQFDAILAVSEIAKQHFLEYFPYLKLKTSVFHNLINEKLIKENSDEFIPDSFLTDYVHITTVGRLEFEKGQDIIPEVIYELKQKKINIMWHLIGDGALKSKIIEKAKRLGVMENIIFEGFQKNPYVYIKGCDLYVQTSRQEGFGITIAEAMILNKVIVSTSFPSIYEQITNGENGFIVDYNPVKMSNIIFKILSNDELRSKVNNNLLSFKYANDIDLIINLLED